MIALRLCFALCFSAAGILCNDSSSHSHSDSNKLYQDYNKDGNHCLSLHEFSNIFMHFDTDWPKDQQISRLEFKDGWNHDNLHDVSDVPFFFELVDHAPHDNVITEHEVTELYNNVFVENHAGCVSSTRFRYVWNALFNAVG